MVKVSILARVGLLGMFGYFVFWAHDISIGIGHNKKPMFTMQRSLPTWSPQKFCADAFHIHDGNVAVDKSAQLVMK